jgi:chorismate mutase
MWRGGPVAVRAVRGATQVEVDEREHVLAVSRELVSLVLEKNRLRADDVISITFTATRDLASVAPALAARQLGLHEVALICAQEMWVEGSLPVGGYAGGRERSAAPTSPTCTSPPRCLRGSPDPRAAVGGDW